MTYKEYPGYTKAYIIMHCTGFGVMEARYIDKEVVFETDDIEAAKSKAKELEFENNTLKEIESTWIPNTYHININTLAEKGKELHAEFCKEFDQRFKDIKKNKNYNKVKIAGHEIYFQSCPIFDDPPAKKGTFSTRIIWSEPKN